MYSRNLEIFEEGIVVRAHIRQELQGCRRFCGYEVQRRQADFKPMPKEVTSIPNATLSGFSSKPYEQSSSLSSPPQLSIPDLSAGTLPDAWGQFPIDSDFIRQLQTVTKNLLKSKTKSGKSL
jgi:hypothetical protein